MFKHLNPHFFTSHRERTRRYFAHHDMPYPIDCAILGHKPIWIDLGNVGGFMECSRCTLRPHLTQTTKRWTKPDLKTETKAFLERTIDEGEVYWRPRRAESHLEISSGYVDCFDIQFKMGNASSETPFDAHLIIPGWRGFYVGTNVVGNRIANWRSRRASKENRYKSRVYSFRVDNDSVRYSLGAYQGEWSRDQPWWWEGNWSYRDFILGKREYSKVEHETAEIMIPMPEGLYLAKATLATQTWTRKRFAKPEVQHSIQFAVDGGIPNGRHKYGDWDSTRGWAISVPDGDFTDWDKWAPPRAAMRILDDRKRYSGRSDWLPPEVAQNPKMVEG